MPPTATPYTAIPSGWYAVGFSRDLSPGEVRTLRYFDRDLVLYRTEGGQAVLTDAHCPHLGAHLGEGGTVEGEHLRCPFHGFCFEPSGACASTPYAHKKVPPKARLGIWPLHERNGLLLAYFHPQREAPTWSVPELDADGWSGLKSTGWRLRSHPQETSENSVDLGHFTAIHGFLSADLREPLATEGPLLTIGYDVEKHLGFIGLSKQGFKVSFDIEVHGLGYSLVRATVPALGLKMRHFVLSTPIDASHVFLHIATQAHDLGVPGLTRAAARAAFWGLRHEVSQDFRVWANKRYLDRPALAAGDGPIGAYRRWCKQFYAAAPPSAPPPSPSSNTARA